MINVNPVAPERLRESLECAVAKVMRGALHSDDLVMVDVSDIASRARTCGLDAECVVGALDGGAIPTVEVGGQELCSTASVSEFCFSVYESGRTEAEFGFCCSKYDDDEGAAPRCEAFVPVCALSHYLDAVRSAKSGQ